MPQRVDVRARLHTRSQDAKALRRCGKVEWGKGAKRDRRNGRDRQEVATQLGTASAMAAAS